MQLVTKILIFSFYINAPAASSVLVFWVKILWQELLI